MTVVKEGLLWITILKEEIKIDDSEMLKCLNEKGIEVCGHYFQSKKNQIYKRDIENQIDLIVDMHKRIAGMKPEGVFRIESKILFYLLIDIFSYIRRSSFSISFLS